MFSAVTSPVILSPGYKTTMKKIISFLAASFFLLQTHAQSIGINTSDPDPSAILDIRGYGKGLLIPRIFLTSSHDSTTIIHPATSLLVYNTDASMPFGKGYYYNSGTDTLPEWTSLKPIKFTLPYKDTITSGIDAFSISNLGTGNALTVRGKIKFYDTQEPNGRFLMTSWPDGNVNWVGGHTFCATNIGANNLAVSPDVDTKVPFYTELYDVGNNFIIGGSVVLPSTFVATEGGIYHFDASIMWETFTNSTINVYGALGLFINGSLYFTNRQNAASASFSNSISTDIMLSAGDKITLMAYHNSPTAQYISNDSRTHRFSGRYVSTY